MPILFFIALCFIAVIITFFVSRKLSPIPYFPSNKNDIESIVRSLQISNDQIVYDLGAGDGIVIFSAASEAFDKKLNTRFIAVEINPVLIVIMWVRRHFHSNRKNIQILKADMFTSNFKFQISNYKKITFFVYISPWYLEKVFTNCKSQMPKFKFISYFYPVPKLKSSRTIKGVHNTYIYNV